MVKSDGTSDWCHSTVSIRPRDCIERSEIQHHRAQNQFMEFIMDNFKAHSEQASDNQERSEANEVSKR